MGWITVTGPVTGVKEMEDLARNKYLSFRIGGKPVTSYIKMNLMENDQVIAVGTDTAEPQIEGLRNTVTKVEYAPQENPVNFPIGGIIFGVIMIPFLFLGVGILFFVWIGHTNGIKSRDRAREIKRLLNASS
jgi:hypothetical protein